MNELVLTFIILLTWPSLLYRFYKGFASHTLQEAYEHRKQVTYRMWPPALTMALAGTAYHPAIIHYLDETVWAGFGMVPCNTLAMLGVVMASRICLDFIPNHMHPRWDWYKSVAVLTMITFMILSGLPDNPQADLIANIIFSVTLLILVVRMILPALSWVIRLEKVIATRLRIKALRGMFVFVVIWMVNDISQNLFLIMDRQLIELTYQILNSVTIFGVGILFCMSFFVSQRVFEKLTYLHELNTLLHIRLLELVIYRWLAFEGGGIGRRHTTMSIRSMTRAPAHMTYRSVIAILDTVKTLDMVAAGWMKRLALRLKLVTRPQLGYDEVVERLISIPLEILPRLVFAFVYFEIRTRFAVLEKTRMMERM